jgi:hypothetical protein
MKPLKLKDVQIENLQNNNPAPIGYIATHIIQFVAQTHVWHLLKNNKNNNLKQLHESLQLEVSNLAEPFIAQGGRLETVGIPIVAYYDEAVIRVRINELRFLVNSAIEDSSDMSSTVDSLINMREILDNSIKDLS